MPTGNSISHLSQLDTCLTSTAWLFFTAPIPQKRRFRTLFHAKSWHNFMAIKSNKRPQAIDHLTDKGKRPRSTNGKKQKRRPTCRPDTKREITKAKTIGPFVLHYPSFALSLHIGKEGTPIHKKAFSNQTNCYRYIYLLNYENPTFIPLLPVDPGSTGQSRRRTIGTHRPWRIAEDQDRTG